MKAKLLILQLLLLGGLAAFAQGFINLDFESAKIIPLPNLPIELAASNALPGWTASIGTTPFSSIGYNSPGIGGTLVSIWATNAQVISGNYSVLIQHDPLGSAPSISQTGVVPAWAMSLQFAARPQIGLNSTIDTLQLTLGGQIIPFFALSTGANSTLYSGDVSMFAGQTQALIFSVLGSSGYPGWTLDDIQFSAQVIPEPSVAWLVLVGGAGLFFARRKRVQCNQ